MPLRRLVSLVCVLIGAETAFYAVVAPLLPHYADELGLSKLTAGALTAAYPAGVLLGALPSGVVAGRIGAKRTVIGGTALVAVASVGFGAAHALGLLMAMRFLQGLGGAFLWSGGLAWITSLAPHERRGEMIGTAMGSAVAGSLFGPVLGAVAQATSPEAVFDGVAVLMLALLAAAVTMPADAPSGSHAFADAGRSLTDGDVRTGMWLVTLPAVVFGAITVLGPLRLHHLGFGGSAVAATFLVCAAVEASESPVVGRVSDRLGRLVPIRFGLLAAIAVLLVIGLPHVAGLYAAGLVALTAGLGVFWAPAMALLSDAAERTGTAQGIAFALTNLAWGCGEILGAGGGGALARASSDGAVLVLLALLCAATLTALRARMVRTAAA